MSQLNPKAVSGVACAVAKTSAWPLIADLIADIPDGQLGAISGREQMQQGERLFDHLVGDGKQSRRYREVERFGSFAIDDQLIFGRCLDRQVGRFVPPEDAIDIRGPAPVLIDCIDSIGDQSASVSKGNSGVDRRQTIAGRQSGDEVAIPLHR